MKRALIAVGLLAWTVVVIAATALWMFAGSGSVVFRELLDNSRPVRVSFYGMTADDEPWMFSTSEVFARGNRVHVKREDRPDGALRLIVAADMMSGSTATFDFHKRSDGVDAVACVDWTSDAGPPFRGSMSSVTGEVSLSSIDWSASHPLIVHFDLHGIVEGQPRCVHGEVSAPR